MAFWKLTRFMPRFGTASAASVLLQAFRHGVTVHFSFVDQNRVQRDMECRILALRRDSLQLELCRQPALAAFRNEKCHLYFKLPRRVLPALGIRGESPQNGFLCKSHILGSSFDESAEKWLVSVARPESYTRRELRRCERHRILAGMFGEADVWIAPPQEGALPAPDFSFRSGEPSPLHVQNLSAAGVKLALEDVDYEERFTGLASAPVFLHLSLNRGGGTQDAFLRCACVAFNYSIARRRLVLRLRFVGQSFPPLTREELERAPEFCPVIENWLEESSFAEA